MLHKKLLLLSVSLFLAGNNCNASMTEAGDENSKSLSYKEYAVSCVAGTVTGTAAGALTSLGIDTVAGIYKIDLKKYPKLATVKALSVKTGAVVGATGGLACQYFNPAEGVKSAALNPIVISGQGIYSGTSVCGSIAYKIVSNRELRDFGKGLITAVAPACATYYLQP